MRVHDYMLVTNNHRRFYNALPIYTEIDYYDRENGVMPYWIDEKRIDGDIMHHTELHCHEDFELLLIREGCAEIKINNDMIHASKGDLIIFNPYDMHSIEVNLRQPSFSRLLLIFDLDLLYDNRYPQYFSFITHLKTEMLKYKNLIPKDSEYNTQIQVIMENLYKANSKQSDSSSISVIGYLYLILSELHQFNRSSSANALSSSNEENEFIEKVFTYIKEHHSEQISTDDAATAMSYNKSYFCRLFRKYFERSFTEYLNIYRIYRAKYLMIQNRDIKIAQLSSAVGFSTPGFFSQIFKKYTGVLPSGYLKSISSYDKNLARSEKNN